MFVCIGEMGTDPSGAVSGINWQPICSSIIQNGSICTPELIGSADATVRTKELNQVVSFILHGHPALVTSSETILKSIRITYCDNFTANISNGQILLHYLDLDSKSPIKKRFVAPIVRNMIRPSAHVQYLTPKQ